MMCVCICVFLLPSTASIIPEVKRVWPSTNSEDSRSRRRTTSQPSAQTSLYSSYNRQCEQTDAIAQWCGSVMLLWATWSTTHLWCSAVWALWTAGRQYRLPITLFHLNNFCSHCFVFRQHLHQLNVSVGTDAFFCFRTAREWERENVVWSGLRRTQQRRLNATVAGMDR